MLVLNNSLWQPHWQQRCSKPEIYMSIFMIFVILLWCHGSVVNSHADLVLQQDDELRAEDEATELPRLYKQTEKNTLQQSKSISNPSWGSTVKGMYLLISARLQDYGESVMIGRRGAQDIYYGAHLLYSVKACDWRAHDFSIGQKRTWIIRYRSCWFYLPYITLGLVNITVYSKIKVYTMLRSEVYCMEIHNIFKWSVRNCRETLV